MGSLHEALSQLGMGELTETFRGEGFETWEHIFLTVDGASIY